MKRKENAIKIVLSVLCLSFYLFMATGSDESSSDSNSYEEPTYEESTPIHLNENEPVFSNDEIEEEQDTILMKDTYDNDDILEE